jgi:hypothetical protein
MKNSRIATLQRSLQHEGGRRHKLCDTVAEEAVSMFQVASLHSASDSPFVVEGGHSIHLPINLTGQFHT